MRRGSVPVAHLRVDKFCDYAAGALKRLRIAISLQHKLVDVACAVSFFSDRHTATAYSKAVSLSEDCFACNMRLCLHKAFYAICTKCAARPGRATSPSRR